MSNAITRRSFLSSSLALASLSRLHAEKLDFGPYTVGVQTYCFKDLDLDGLLFKVQDLGLKNIEIYEKHLPADASVVRVLAAKASLYAAEVRPVSIYTNAFTADELQARRIFDLAEKMDLQFINGGHKREALPLLNRLVAAYKMGVAIHNHGPGTTYDKLEDVTSALDEFPNLSACIDIGHFARSGVNPAEAIRKIGRRVVEVHIKDLSKEDQNTIVGTGRIDLRAMFSALRKIKFKGLLTLEYEGDWDDLARRMEAMHESLRNISRLIAGKPLARKKPTPARSKL